MTQKTKEEELKGEIDKIELKIREEFENIKNQHIEKIKRKWGKLVDIEKQIEGDILANINSNIEIIKLQSQLKGFQQGKAEGIKIISKQKIEPLLETYKELGKAEAQKEFIKMIDELAKDSSDGDNEDIMDYNQALIDILWRIKYPFHSQQGNSKEVYGKAKNLPDTSADARKGKGEE